MPEENKHLQEEIQKYREEEAAKSGKSIEAQVETQVKEEYVPKDEWEEKAVKIGWKPDHEGENFVDAREYVLRKPLFERIERQTSELRAIKESQRKTAEHLAQVRKEAYEQAIRDLEQRREAAVADADTVNFKHWDQQANNLRQQMSRDPIVNVPPPETPPVDPNVERLTKSDWYNTNSPENAKMVAAAKAVDAFLAQQAHIDGVKIDPKRHIDAVEGEVKRLFPHRFGLPTQASQQQEPDRTITNQGSTMVKPVVQAVATNTAPTSSLYSSSKNLAARLTPQQRELGEQFHRSNPDFTLEEYAKQLQSMGRLGK